MKLVRYFWIVFFLIGLTILSCVEPYLPPVIENNPNYLVINGMLNLNGTAEFRLTYTTNISSIEPPPKATNALVQIQDDANNKYTLPETSNGIYSANNLQLDLNKKYRLYIKTSSNKEYQSDLVELKESPPIDSISYLTTPTSDLNINVNTHDPSEKTKYYRWTYSETWEYSMPYFSYYRMINRTFYPRSEADYINTCWKTTQSTNVVIGSTNRLEEDVVSNFTLLTIPAGSFKASRKYSILVKQYALTEQGYNYWLNLQKTTESVGGLFDPLPAQIQGNIYCISDPSEKAIGFFMATNITELREFITPDQLPEGYIQYTPEFCTIDSVMFEPFVEYGVVEEILYPIGNTGFVISHPRCVDCRYHGGITTKPDFWN